MASLGEYIIDNLFALIAVLVSVTGFIVSVVRRDGAIEQNDKLQEVQQQIQHRELLALQQKQDAIQTTLNQLERRLSLIENFYPKHEANLEQLNESFRVMTETMIEMKSDLKHVITHMQSGSSKSV